MKQKLLGASRVAEISGVSRQAITKHFNEKFPDAKVGKKWNVYHPGVFEYLKAKGVDVINSDLRSAPQRSDPQAKNPVSQKRNKHTEQAKKRAREPTQTGSKKSQNKTPENVNGLQNERQQSGYSLSDNPDISESE